MKKIISLLLAVVMVASLLPVTAFAEVYVDGESKGTETVSVDSAQYVSANAAEDDLTVTGNVTGDGEHNSVIAQNGAEITVGGTVTEKAGGSAINASYGAAVEAGSVDEKNDGDAIYATEEATVTIEGNVTESGEGNAIKAKDTSMVKVGGNVTGNNAGSTINAQDNATIIVEGCVTGDINLYDNAVIYLGQLEGNIDSFYGASLDNVHYLIGTAANSPAKLSDVTLVSNIVEGETIDGINKEGYRYTTTADTTALNGKTITLKPADGKILTVSGFDGETVTYTENGDGSVTFTIGENFTGGLQNLVLKLTDKQIPEEPVRRHKNTTTVTIGDRDDKEETKAEETSEENPNTGAPVMNLGALAVVLGAVYVISKKH